MKITVCIPMYNEAKVIGNTARTLHEFMTNTFGEGNFEIIFSNDGSRDDSAEIVKSLSLDGVKVIGNDINHGKGYAVRAAMLEAKGDIVMFTDADLAYGAEIIKGFYDYFTENPDADCLIGSRNISKDGYEGYTFIRKVASKVYLKILCVVGGFKLSDSQCGCKAFRNHAAKKIFRNAVVDRFAFDFEAILLANKFGLTIHEYPVKVINHGESKVRMVKDSIKMIKDLREMRKRIKNTNFEG